MDDTEANATTTPFHSGQASSQRLSELLNQTNELSLMCSYDPKAFTALLATLKRVYMELSPDLGFDEKKDIKKLFILISKVAPIYKKYYDSEGGASDIPDIKAMAWRRRIMDKIEEKLRKLANNKGLLRPTKKEDITY